MRKVGQNYWCILPSNESQSYGEYKPKKPWWGRLQHTGTGSFQIQHIGSDGEPDDDSNATSHIDSLDSKHLFDTITEANEAYKQSLFDYIVDQLRVVDETVKELITVGVPQVLDDKLCKINTLLGEIL